MRSKFGAGLETGLIKPVAWPSRVSLYRRTMSAAVNRLRVSECDTKMTSSPKYVDSSRVKHSSARPAQEALPRPLFRLDVSAFCVVRGFPLGAFNDRKGSA